MANKSDSFYFNNFIESAQIACEAASLLRKVLVDFDPTKLEETLIRLHEIEHRGDEKRHQMTSALVRAFITPIEREDLLCLSQKIDDVTDCVEDIFIRIYINNVTEIRPDSIDFMNLIVDCCNAMKEMLEEFQHFKKSRKLSEIIVEINRLEELGDELFIRSMRELHSKVNEPLEVIAWREIYAYFEKCCDMCEHVADIVESITIGNK